MSKKKKKSKQKLAHIHAQQKTKRPAERLQEVQQALQNGDLNRALLLAETLQRTPNDAQVLRQAKELWVETLFRLAIAATTPHKRLEQIDKALSQEKNDARLHYQRAVTLWHLGHPEQALAALEQVATLEPNRPSVAYLRQLGRLRTGQSWQSAQLDEDECNTLHFLEQMRQIVSPAVRQAQQDQPPQFRQLLPEQTDKLWRSLLQMHLSPKSLPSSEFSQSIPAEFASLPVIHYYRGILAVGNGNLKEALSLWQKAASMIITPWLGENLLHLQREVASALAEEEQWAEIVTLFQQAANQKPSEAIDAAYREIVSTAYFQLGYQAAQANQWQEAVDRFRAASNLSSSRQLAQNLALAEEATGDWSAAAEAWREMVRRRPRKADHPDSLTDDQVAVIWEHAARCYEEIEDVEETITCLKNALKYAPNDLALRLNLLDTLHSAGRIEATENELERVLEIDPNHIQALMRQAAIFSGRYDRDAKPIWEKILTLEPNNEEAQQALAHIYANLASSEPQFYSNASGFIRRTPKQKLEILETGLKQLPNHPLLLIKQGDLFRETKQEAKARTSYSEAGRVALAKKDLSTVDYVLHELLHVNGGAIIKEWLPQVSQFPGLLADFWIEQGEKAMDCELGESWAELFWDEAVCLSELTSTINSRAATLLKAFDSAQGYELTSVAQKYEKRLKHEHPQSGALDYIEAIRFQARNPEKTAPIKAALRKAKLAAKTAKEPIIVEMVEEFEEQLSFPLGSNPFNMLNKGILQDLMKEFSREELDVLRELF